MNKVVKVVLSNRTAQFLEPYPREDIRCFFRYRPDGYYFSRKYRMGVWDGWIYLFRGHCAPAGAFLDVKDQIEETLSLRFAVQDQRRSPGFNPLPTRLRLLMAGNRSYQQSCVEAMVDASGRGGGLVLCATGTGKTFVAGAYLAHLEGPACFIVDELTLLDQARRELHRVLREPIGWVGESRYEPQRVTVATIQTLHRHRRRKDFLSWYRRLIVLIIDEIHVALNRRNIDVVRLIKPLTVFGLTATLEIQKPAVRLRATALAGPVIYQYPLIQGVADQVLAPGVVVQVAFPAKGLGGSYADEYRQMVVQSKKRNDLTEALVREGLRGGRKVILLVERLKHLDIFAARFADVKHRVMCGRVCRQDRVQAKRDMDAGQLPLILANRVFGKGVDIRQVDMIVDATATRSKNNALQRFGRGVRIADGKKGLLYVDIGDVSLWPSSDRRYNRFGSCTRSRLQAFEKAGVKVIKMRWLGDSLEVCQAGEHALLH